MKQIIYIILTVFLILFTACTVSERKRAQQLTDEFDTQFMEGNRSLKPIGKVHLDSARVEFLYLPETRERMKVARLLAAENQACLKALQQPVTDESTYRELTRRLWDTGTNAKEAQQELLEDERKHDARVSGWMALHRFRIIDPGGQMKLHQYVLYFDSAVTRIRGVINLNDSLPEFRELK